MQNNNDINQIKKLIKDGFDLELISLEFEISMDELKKYKRELNKTENETNIGLDENEIKNLIKEGFDPKLISLEFGIQLEKVKQYQDELKENQVKDMSSVESKRINELKSSIYKKIEIPKTNMDLLRERYKLLYESSNRENKPERKQSDEELNMINSVIEAVESKTHGIEELDRREKRSSAINIMSELKKIEEIPLTIDQAQKLLDLIDLEKMKNLNINMHDYTETNMRKARNRIIKKLADAIDIKQSETDNIEELKELRRKLTSDMQKENYLSVEAVKGRISNRISKIQQQNVIHKIRYDVPECISDITKQLASGSIDIENANIIIEKEAKERVANKPKTRFSLNEEQEKKQIFMQIKTLISERAEEFCINNPEKVIEQMQQLLGGEKYDKVNAVINNLIERKEFKLANEICMKYSPHIDDYYDSKMIYMRELKKKVRNAEISDMVLKGIHMNGTKEEDERYFEFIENGLKRGNVNPEAISLGKSQDGLRTITLANIWKNSGKGKSAR